MSRRVAPAVVVVVGPVRAQGGGDRLPEYDAAVLLPVILQSILYYIIIIIIIIIIMVFLLSMMILAADLLMTCTTYSGHLVWFPMTHAR